MGSQWDTEMCNHFRISQNFSQWSFSNLMRTRRRGVACPVWETKTEWGRNTKRMFLKYWFFSHFFCFSSLSLSFSLESKHYQGAVGECYVGGTEEKEAKRWHGKDGVQFPESHGVDKIKETFSNIWWYRHHILKKNS